MGTAVVTPTVATERETTVGIKAVHLFFIAVCTALFAGMGYWRLTGPESGVAVTLQAGVLFLASLGLAGYAVVFVRKLRDFSYM